MAKAKRDEYPQNKSLQARLRAVLEANSAMKAALNNVVLSLESKDGIGGGVTLPVALAAKLLEIIDAALKQADIASDAISGEE